MIEAKESLIGNINASDSLQGSLNKAIEYVSPTTQEKSITPTKEVQEVKPDEGIFALSKVIVEAVTNEIDENIKAENIKKGVEILGVEGSLKEGEQPSLNLLNMRAGTFTLTNSAILQTNTDTPCYLEPNTTYTLVIEYENLNTTVADAKINVGIGCGKDSYAKDIEGAISYPTDNSGKLIHTFNTGTKINEGERLFVRPIRISASSNTGTTSVYWKNVMLLKGTYDADNVPEYIPVTNEDLAKGLFNATAEGTIRGKIVDEDILTLHNYSFYGRTNLEKVVFPNLANIYAYSFYNNTKLTYADLGYASSLNVGTFQGCTELKAVILRKSSVVTLHSTGAFANSGISLRIGYIYVPDELVENYKSATNWSTYASQIKGISYLNPETAPSVLLLHAEDFTDSSINNLTINNNNVSIVDGGKFGKCFYNDNTNYIETTLPNALGNNFTIDFWIKLNAYPTISEKFAVPFSLGEYNDGVYFQLETSTTSKTLYVWLGNKNNSIDAEKIPLNTWTHLAVTFDGKKYDFYLNGERQFELENTVHTSQVNLNLFRSGGSVTLGRHFKGYIDEVKIVEVVRWTDNFTPPAEPYS